MFSTSPVLPFELLNLIAQHLIDDKAFGTCASLNTTSHAVNDATLKTLWTYMLWMPSSGDGACEWNVEEAEAKWAVFSASPGAKYIRQAVFTI
jgi:hypothetical protein